jgi:hypothetical protein
MMINHSPTYAEMEAARSSKGGWTPATLASWGIPWPPPKGWRKQLLAQMTDVPHPALASHSLENMEWNLENLEWNVSSKGKPYAYFAGWNLIIFQRANCGGLWSAMLMKGKGSTAIKHYSPSSFNSVEEAKAAAVAALKYQLSTENQEERYD